MAKTKPKQSDEASDPTLDDAEDHLFIDDYQFDRRITQIREIYLLKTPQDRRIEADTWYRFLARSLHVYWVHYDLKQGRYHYAEAVRFAMLLHRMIDDLREAAEDGMTLYPETWAKRAIEFKEAWLDFQRTGAEMRAERAQRLAADSVRFQSKVLANRRKTGSLLTQSNKENAKFPNAQKDRWRSIANEAKAVNPNLTDSAMAHVVMKRESLPKSVKRTVLRAIGVKTGAK
jgi:hypothetical protein